MTVDKELLFKPRLTEVDFEVEGFGIFRIRALSRAEAMLCQKMDDVAAIERKMLALGLVDPEMTEAEIGQWQKASAAGEMEAIAFKVAELSGMTQGAAKEAYVAFEENPDAEFRLPPG